MRLAVGWAIAASASLVGLWASFSMDLPTGAAIVCACGLALVVVTLGVSVRQKRLV